MSLSFPYLDGDPESQRRPSALAAGVGAEAQAAAADPHLS